MFVLILRVIIGTFSFAVTFGVDVLLLHLFAGVTFEETDLAPRLWYIGRFLSRLGTYCLVVLGLDD